MQTKLSTAVEITRNAIQHNLNNTGGSKSSYICPMWWSLPGEGKTTAMNDLGDSMNMEVRSVIAATYDAGEFAGFPIVSDGDYVRVKPMWFPTEGQGMLFFDELPQAPTALQNLIARVANERELGEFKLGDGWTVVCAGNPQSSKAGTNQMPTHLRDRLLHINIMTDIDGFREYALSSGWDPVITTYLNERPEWLQKFDPKADACPSPRSWERVNTILGLGLDQEAEMVAIAGLLGDGAVADFTGYRKIWKDMPRVKDVLSNPTGHSIPSDPAILYALCSSLAHHANKSNIKDIITYTNRLPNKEFSVFCMTDVLKRFPELKTEKVVGDWYMTEGKDLMM